MKKRIIPFLFSAAALLLCFSLSFAYGTASADDGETVTEPPAETTQEEQATSVIDAAQAFFEDKILPILLSFGGVILSGIIALPTVISKFRKVQNAKTKAEQTAAETSGMLAKASGMLTALNDELESLKKRTDYSDIITNTIDNALLKPLASQQKAISETNLNVAVLTESISAVEKALMLICQKNHEAAATALAAAPTAKTLTHLSLELDKVKGAYRQLKGEEAEKELVLISEAVRNE